METSRMLKLGPVRRPAQAYLARALARLARAEDCLAIWEELRRRHNPPLVETSSAT